MAAIDFPSSPAVNDEFTAGTSVYVWNGTTWTFKQSTLPPSSLSDSNPVMNSSAAAGTSGLASRADHVHPTDTSRASTTHASTHASAGSDPITIAQSQVTNLTTDLSGKIDKSIVNAKGDLVTATGNDTPAILTVGSNGQILMADSSTTEGIRYVNYPSGNILVNGNFSVFQRSSFSSQAGSGYCLDRWYCGVGGTVSVTQQTTGAPIGSQHCARITYNANSSFGNLFHALEFRDARQLFGRTVTFSIKLRRSSTFTTDLRVAIVKNSTADTLTGGSWSAIGILDVSNSSLPTGNGSSDWYTAIVQATVPDDGTANGLRVQISEMAVQPANAYYEVAQAKLEIGPVATPFDFEPYETTLRKCQRYYQRWNFDESSYAFLGAYGIATSTTTINFYTTPIVSMRTKPSLVEFSGLHATDTVNNLSISSFGIDPNQASLNGINATATTSGATQFRPYVLRGNNNTSAYVAYSAEL